MSLLKVEGLSHSYGDKVLYKNASFDLYKGEHLGIVGHNGCGKSTLIGILTGEVVSNDGQIKWQSGIKIGYLDQYALIDTSTTILEYLQTSFSELYKLEKKIQQLYETYVESGDEKLLVQASNAQTRLDASEFYEADTLINKVVTGLGLDVIGIERSLSQLSGGQRAKIILAKLLLEQPDVLLLDEPTNFLDKEHVDWLIEYLAQSKKAYIVVSHDFEFLDKIANCICDVENQTIKKYHGRYSDFVVQKEHLKEEHLRNYTSQQVVIKKTEEYIRKNIAGVNCKNAKGRRKQLERLERIEPPNSMSKPIIKFKEAHFALEKVLKVKDLEVGYHYPLLPKLNFSIQGGEKIAITGFNGVGKSTLLKTLMGQIPPIKGSFQFAQKAKLGYYEQELNWENNEMIPIQVIHQAYPKLEEKQIRKHLADTGVKSVNVRQAIATLSGGEQSKVKMCKLLLTPYNFLILDEPTNHLDADTKEELLKALTIFGGSVVMVSHEESFYRNWADKIFNIEKGTFI